MPKAETAGGGPRSRIRVALAVLLAFVLIVSACSGDDDQGPGDDGSGDSGSGDDGESSDSSAAGDRTGPLTVSLSNGQAHAEAAQPAQVVDGDELDDGDVDAVIDRLGEWTEPDEDRSDFERPAETLPPPRVGEEIDVPFPADTDPPEPEVPTGPLEVLRYQPEGSVPVAPFLSVTFNQPMVPLATLGQLAAEDVPVTLTPELEGRWEWIGTKTLRFEHTSDEIDRLPMASTYTVEVPAGTTSETGGALAETVAWQFETPTVTVENLFPLSESLPLEPVFVAALDQRIDPDAVLGAVTLTANGEPQEIRLATDDEIAADEDLAERIDTLLEDRWLAFRPNGPLPADAALEITFGAGTPSAEGPNTTAEPRGFEGRTYAPLAVDDHNCDEFDCGPNESLVIWFNNALDEDAFDAAQVVVSPELPGAYVFAQGNTIEIRGATAASTTYEVTVSGDLTDEFGQTLGEAQTLSLDVGAARTTLQQFQQPMVTLDPLAATPTLPVISTNHGDLRVRVYSVDPRTDWGTYFRYREQGQYDPDNAFPGFALVSDTNVSAGDTTDEAVETSIDVGAALNGGPGHLVVRVDPTGELADLPETDDRYWDNRPTSVWVQSTDIGFDVFGDGDEVVAWATDLATGAPLPGVTIDLLDAGVTVTTDDDGLAGAPRAEGMTGSDITATLGADVALQPTGNLASVAGEDTAIAHVFDDRGIYRPGETARVKGWVRRLARTDDSHLVRFAADSEISYAANDWYGNVVAEGTVTLDAFGGFDLEVEIPEGANLGTGHIQFNGTVDDVPARFDHSFEIQEFRRPEFEVSTRAETPGPYHVDDPATVAVEAVYFSGGALPDAAVEWNVTTRRTQYTPPNREDFSFGIPPLWVEDSFYGGDVGFGRGFGFESDICCFPEEEPLSVETFSGVTDSSGTHYLEMAFEGDDEGQPTTVSAEATVFDVNRQAWASTTDLVVHPGELYVGLRSPRNFVKQGDPLVVEAIVTDVDGNAVAGRDISLDASRLESQYVDGEWTDVAVDTQTCSVTSDEDAVECTFDTAEGGQYEIVVEVADDVGRTSRTELTRWVSGGDTIPARNVEQQNARLIPDKESYQPGDTAEILVESPFGPAEGLLTIARDGIVRSEVFTVAENTTVIEIPIEDRHVPNLEIQVDLAGVTERVADDGTPLPDVADRPAYAIGRVHLEVAPTTRTLTVEATPATDPVEPGTDTSLDIAVSDADGDPVADAQLAVVIVDEAVLALTGYEMPDPLDTFYAPLEAGFWSSAGRETIVLTDPEELPDDLPSPSTTIAGLHEGAGGDGDDSAEDAAAGTVADSLDGARSADFDEAGYALAPQAANLAQGPDGEVIGERTDFDALVVFEPDVVTDADGAATIDVPLPDNLTRYRVMVTAVSGDDRFGSVESNLTARLPLMVRPSPPRFLNFGDSFELPVVLQNQTDADMEVDVVVEAANLDFTGPAGKRVTVPADDRIEVRFPAATDSAGTARFRVAAVSGDHADAATQTLPVYTPATAEAFATYGVVDDGSIAQPVLAPTDVFPQFGGLEIDTSSTALQSLTDAVLYLHDYEYLSADGYATRILAVAGLRNVLSAFQAEGLPAPDVLEADVQSDIENLVALQNGDGGFPYWQRGRESIPIVSIEAAHALVMARLNGFSVPDEPYQAAQAYLRDIEARYPPEYDQRTKDTLSAYALNVRMLADDRDSAKAGDLYARAGADIGLDGVAWLWPVLEDAAAEAEILRLFENRATETAGAATFTTDYGESAYLILQSDRRTDGIILDSLIREAPDSTLIPKVVAGLLGNQTQGRWDNAQENSFILLAMDNYFDTFEDVTPDFVARIWLGDTYAGEHVYQGRTTDRNGTLVPTQFLVDQGDSEIVVAKEGAGRLYYRLGLRYAPSDLDLDPLDRGFVVTRTYEAIDDEDDVRRDEDGTWHVKAGADVRVRLTMVADSRRTHAALVDPLPAGFEAQNPDLANVPEPPPDPEEEDRLAAESGDIALAPLPAFNVASSYWWGPWYEHENLRDDRVEAFASLLPGGTYDYSYVARATTPGTFVVPPTRAEEIFAPETFGRSSSEVVVVEEG